MSADQQHWFVTRSINRIKLAINLSVSYLLLLIFDQLISIHVGSHYGFAYSRL